VARVGSCEWYLRAMSPNGGLCQGTWTRYTLVQSEQVFNHHLLRAPGNVDESIYAIRSPCARRKQAVSCRLPSGERRGADCVVQKSKLPQQDTVPHAACKATARLTMCALEEDATSAGPSMRPAQDPAAAQALRPRAATLDGCYDGRGQPCVRVLVDVQRA
jgi:hypothetical protein